MEHTVRASPVSVAWGSRRGIATPPTLYATPSQDPVAVFRRYPTLLRRETMVSISSFSFGVLSILNSYQTSFNYFFLAQSLKSGTVEPRYDGPLHNEVLGKRTIFFTPVRVKYMKPTQSLNHFPFFLLKLSKKIAANLSLDSLLRIVFFLLFRLIVR